MNEKDKLAWERACDALYGFGYSEQFSMALWQAALEYARQPAQAEPVQPAVAQEPVGHFVFNQENGYWVQLDKQVWPNGSPISERLYKQAPAAEINEQMLNALKLYIAHAGEPECAIWRHVQAKVKAAIAAAEKAKGGAA